MKKQDILTSNEFSSKHSKSLFSPINFIIKSSLIALILTLPPIITLIVIWEIGLVAPTIMICWVMFSLFWTFYIILKAPDKFI